MKKTEQTPTENSVPQLTRVSRMLRRIQPWLQSQRSRFATFAEMQKWTGVPENTIRGWFSERGHPSAEFLLALLERTPEKVQLEILGEFFRVYPTLNHSRFAGDRAIVSRLGTLLQQSRGLTYIHGADELRTFLITALAHSFGELIPPPRRVLGLDVHAADWFVPVVGVVYLENTFQRDELLRGINSAWPQLRNGESPLVIFNGIWSGFPELQEKIRGLANRCHVLVADESGIEAGRSSTGLSPRTTLITVRADSSQAKSIGLEIRTAP